jgi:hypothetical protein
MPRKAKVRARGSVLAQGSVLALAPARALALLLHELNAAPSATGRM